MRQLQHRRRGCRPNAQEQRRCTRRVQFCQRQLRRRRRRRIRRRTQREPGLQRNCRRGSSKPRDGDEGTTPTRLFRLPGKRRPTSSGPLSGCSTVRGRPLLRHGHTNAARRHVSALASVAATASAADTRHPTAASSDAAANADATANAINTASGTDRLASPDHADGGFGRALVVDARRRVATAVQRRRGQSRSGGRGSGLGRVVEGACGVAAAAGVARRLGSVRGPGGGGGLADCLSPLSSSRRCTCPHHLLLMKNKIHSFKATCAGLDAGCSLASFEDAQLLFPTNSY